MEIHGTATSAQSVSGTESPSPRLVAAAHEFEGQMLKELLKPMTESGDPDSTDCDGGILGEFGAEALGKALSEHGGFGIANQVIARLSQSGNQQASKTVTGNGHRNTVISGLK